MKTFTNIQLTKLCAQIFQMKFKKQYDAQKEKKKHRPTVT